MISEIIRYIQIRHSRRIILGSAGISQRGWQTTDSDTLDVTCESDFSKYWKIASRQAFVAEHVWEHLDKGERYAANRTCLKFLTPGGRLRIAVPDGLHPDQHYRDKVRPGGSGSGAMDHKILFDYHTLSDELTECGFGVQLLEYWDEFGRFHFSEWSSDDGHICRSSRYDPRNCNSELAYTSLIVDGIKPI
jgi:predicted SAM-dependent methyltransferase